MHEYGKDGSMVGVFAFFATSHATDKCGLNGLPLTPNSITIVGRAQRLKILDHPHLCKYIEFHRGSDGNTHTSTSIPLHALPLTRGRARVLRV